MRCPLTEINSVGCDHCRVSAHSIFRAILNVGTAAQSRYGNLTGDDDSRRIVQTIDHQKSARDTKQSVTRDASGRILGTATTRTSTGGNSETPQPRGRRPHGTRPAAPIPGQAAGSESTRNIEVPRNGSPRIFSRLDGRAICRPRNHPIPKNRVGNNSKSSKIIPRKSSHFSVNRCYESPK